MAYKLSEYYEINNWADWEDPDNAVYTMRDISKIRSIKRIGTVDTAETIDDYEYIEDTFFSDQELCDKFVASLTGSVNIYDYNQEAKTYAELYNTTGTYIGGTYTDVNVSLSSDENFWPFKYIPMFNYKVRKSDGTYTYYNSVYAVESDGTVIDNLEAFKEYIRGTFDSTIDPQNEIKLTERNDYNIERTVKSYDPVYDFDYDKLNESDSTRDEWDEIWEEWYDDYDNPADISNTANDKNYKYLTYKNIKFVTEQKPEIKYTQPGIVIIDSKNPDYYHKDNFDYDFAIQAPNKYVTLYESGVDTDIDDIIHIFHNHVNATENYDIIKYFSMGYLQCDKWKEMNWYDPELPYTYSLPAYFNKDCSISSLCSYAWKDSSGDDITYGNENLTGKLKGGSISCCIEAKDTEKCWVSTSGITCYPYTVTKRSGSIFRRKKKTSYKVYSSLHHVILNHVVLPIIV